MPQPPLHLLCVEPRFPGRLGGVADWLVRRRGYRCWFYYHVAEPQHLWPESVGKGLEPVRFNVGGVARESAVPWPRYLERGLCYAYGCWEVLEKYRPRPVDLVLGHSAGLGSTLFVPVTLPNVPVVQLLDYFYHRRAHDLTEETAAELPAAYIHWRQAANAMDLLDIENGVHPWTTSAWQRDLYPPEYHADCKVLFDGVDTRRFQRKEQTLRQPLTIAGKTLPAESRLVTFVSTALDRLRGFDRFLELANRLLRARADVVCAVVGGAIVKRGLDVQFFHQNYPDHLLATTPSLDPERLWFLDTFRPTELATLLARSDLHVCPGRPYPVARSLVEAMSAGCVVMGADSEPLREFLTSGETGLLLPPSDNDAWERQAREVLADPAGHRGLGKAAAECVRDRYAQDVTLPQLAEWVDQLSR